MSGHRKSRRSSSRKNNKSNNNKMRQKQIIKEEEEELSLKFKSLNEDITNNNNDIECDVDKEEKEEEIALRVPMISDNFQQRITEKDRKKITKNRVKRLKQLTKKREDELSADQRKEKLNIIRLEKQRMSQKKSRDKKKKYFKSLEEKNERITLENDKLKEENDKLRTLLAATKMDKSQEEYDNILKIENDGLKTLLSAAYKTLEQQKHELDTFKIGILPTNNNNNIHSDNSDINISSANNSSFNISEPSLKRRRLNNGHSLNTITSSPSYDTSSDIDILEPFTLPLHVSSDNNNDNKDKTHLLSPNIANMTEKLSLKESKISTKILNGMQIQQTNDNEEIRPIPLSG